MAEELIVLHTKIMLFWHVIIIIIIFRKIAIFVQIQNFCEPANVKTSIIVYNLIRK
jgi:hypothetical protein